MSQPGSLCVGIDVSKAILDIAASSAIEQFSVGNDSDGFEAIIAELRMYAIALVLMNVTNGAIVIHTQRLKSDPGGNLLS